MEENICIFGDSIAFGVEDPRNGGWVFSLKKDFEVHNENKYVNVYNLGVDADTSKDVLERFEVEAKARDTTTAIIAIGINDTVYRGEKNNTDITSNEFQDNIEALIQKSKEITNNIVFIGLTKVDDQKVQPIPWSTTGKSYSNEVIQKFDDILELVCEKNDVPYVEMFSLLNTTEDLYDGIHPNTKGHQKMYEHIRDFFTENKLIKTND